MCACACVCVSAVVNFNELVFVVNISQCLALMVSTNFKCTAPCHPVLRATFILFFSIQISDKEKRCVFIKFILICIERLFVFFFIRLLVRSVSLSSFTSSISSFISNSYSPRKRKTNAIRAKWNALHFNEFLFLFLFWLATKRFPWQAKWEMQNAKWSCVPMSAAQ